ncbi:MAG: DNA mismatch repair protein MutL [Sulfobacillus thermosulfidooxidans]|uniref:DNA mismatch repair protein MutL n=1 Tax=Sulfobacillus thermotolerans TaxID=338644 RepID=A0ABM6RVM6_9FIRM|nr:hypothetical protein BXT84_07325 [Sulfobacillus thermotolerans]PSR37446.1 MAG: DNA mismatch repair protein MutL [Sulfobacillus thermosulfidooxidans]
MGRIHILDALVADQIAAGEVVERPASVAKELVENALDAEAQHIDVTLAEGGRQFLAVRDDGHGMDREDLVLCVKRHATSKIERLEDLAQGTTLGFRGEALAAISAVSRMRMASCPRGSAYGYQVQITGGIPLEPQPCAMDQGTEIVVEDLFFNIPARLKALKSPTAELGAVQNTLQHYAIGYPEVAFKLTSEQTVLWQTSGQGRIDETVLQLFGREVASDMLEVSWSGHGVTVTGFVCPAGRHRGTRQGQSLFINRRWVTNWVLRNAVEEAFRPNVPDRRYPYFWLWVTVDGAEVDPNAHPTKAEVRLDHERMIAGYLYRAVTEVLTRYSSSSALRVNSSWEVPVASEEVHANEQLMLVWDRPRHEAPEPDPILHEEYQALVPLAQWQAKYIIAQGPLGLYLIDQHAAHERVYYEEFRKKGRDILVSQPLLIPYTYTCLPAEWAKWQENRALFAEMGFEVEEVGGTTLLVRALPQGLTAPHGDNGGIIRTVLESLTEQDAHQGHPIFWTQEAKYAMAACKAAVKAYRPLTLEEMQTLLNLMARVEDPRGCPHGRPTTLHLSMEEVDRRFGRRG